MHTWKALLILGLLLLGGAGLFSVRAAGPAATATPTPQPTEEGGMVSLIDRISPPPLPDNPTQADYGYQVYYYVCMACHGDRGQGLTPEWVEEWGLEGNACWASKCHASNHPEEGFELPKTIPGVVGGRMLQRFGSALELHDYIAAAMPWHNPGYLSTEEYWQLTAFLLRSNGIDPGESELDAGRAAEIVWRATPTPATPTPALAQPRGGFWQAGPVLALIAALVILLVFVAMPAWRRRRRDEV